MATQRDIDSIDGPAPIQRLRAHHGDQNLDPGAYIGSEPEREAETIPGGVTSGDERIAAYDSRPGLPEEPADDSWSEGQSAVDDVVQEPVGYDPLPRSSDELGTDLTEETPILGGPLPD